MKRERVWLIVLLVLGTGVLIARSDGWQIARRMMILPTPPPALSPAQCHAALSANGARFTPFADQSEAEGCEISNAVRFSALATGDNKKTIAASGLGPLACPAAVSFSRWASADVDEAARRHLGSGLARIETMGSYACRNIAGTTRRSAHAKAEAVDISAFVLEDGRQISVLADWQGGTKKERAFLRAAEQTACARFRLVLGPDYNAAHKDHFHLETDRVREAREATGSARRRFARFIKTSKCWP